MLNLSAVLFPIFLLGFLSLTPHSTLANIVLIGRNTLLAFEDIEANFAPSATGSGQCGTLYVAEPLDACSPLSNKLGPLVQNSTKPPFVLIIRGGCSFEDKVKRAQLAGFKAAIVYDSQYGDLVAMAGSSSGIKIPAVFVSKESGQTLTTYAGDSDVEVWIIPTIENSAWSIMAISFISLLAMSAVLANGEETGRPKKTSSEQGEPSPEGSIPECESDAEVLDAFVNELEESPSLIEKLDMMKAEDLIAQNQEDQPSVQKSYASVVGSDEDLKLEYFSPVDLNDISVAKLDKSDILNTSTYWDSSIVCCILGANPPLEVVKGFLNRIWKEYNIHEVSFLREGKYIVDFLNVADRDLVAQMKYYYFDNKPVLVQKWYPGMKIDLDQLEDIPIWIQFKDLDMKFWSLAGLGKLGSPVGKPIKRDRPTANKTKFAYARIQVEVKVQQVFP